MSLQKPSEMDTDSTLTDHTAPYEPLEEKIWNKDKEKRTIWNQVLQKTAILQEERDWRVRRLSLSWVTRMGEKRLKDEAILHLNDVDYDWRVALTLAWELINSLQKKIITHEHAHCIQRMVDRGCPIACSQGRACYAGRLINKDST